MNCGVLSVFSLRFWWFHDVIGGVLGVVLLNGCVLGVCWFDPPPPLGGVLSLVLG